MVALRIIGTTTSGWGRNLESFSDDDVRRGGALIKSPAGWWIFTGFATDSRKMIQLRLNPIFSWNDDRRSYATSVRLRLRIRPVSNIELSIGPMYRYRVDDAQWVELVEENLNGQTEKHYVYGEAQEPNTGLHHPCEHQLYPDAEPSVLRATLYHHWGVYKLQGVG